MSKNRKGLAFTLYEYSISLLWLAPALSVSIFIKRYLQNLIEMDMKLTTFTGESNDGMIAVSINGTDALQSVSLNDKFLKQPKPVMETLITTDCNNATMEKTTLILIS